MQKTTQKYFFPYEFLEANWRLWSFIILIAAGSVALILYPVAVGKDALIDPFYSPTVLIVPIPGLFRLTCYAYRKDYHRHLFHHPLGCENPERDERHNQKYTGERNAIFQFENLHRYFLYAGISLLPFFYYDFYYSSVHYSGPGITSGITLTLGSLVILSNALALTGWTLSCHAFRHLIGGNIDCYSCVPGGKGRKKIFDIQTWWNTHHEALAWISLLTIIFADLYIRAVAAGIPINPVLFHL